MYRVPQASRLSLLGSLPHSFPSPLHSTQRKSNTEHKAREAFFNRGEGEVGRGERKMAREREAHLTERVEAMEKRLAESLTALSMDMGTKAQWDQAQWECLGREMEGCRKEIAEVGRQVGLAAVWVAITTQALPPQRQQE